MSGTRPDILVNHVSLVRRDAFRAALKYHHWRLAATVLVMPSGWYIGRRDSVARP